MIRSKKKQIPSSGSPPRPKILQGASLRRIPIAILVFVTTVLIASAQGDVPDQTPSDAARQKWDHLIDEVITRSDPYHSGVKYKDFTLSALVKRMPASFFAAFDAPVLVEWIKDEFERSKPARNRQRDRLFMALDVAAVASRNDQFAPLVNYRKESTRKIHDLLSKAPPATTLTLYKLYNEGTIIRAPGICFGVDIVLHPDNNDLVPGLAKMLDGLFVSHTHGDHHDRRSDLLPALKKLGKPVILPKPKTEVPIGHVLRSGRFGSLVWSSFQGMHVQIDKPSSFFLFHIGNWKIVHSGDNTRWMTFAKSEQARDVDIFLLKPEVLYVKQSTSDGLNNLQAALKESLATMRPKLVIPHHLLELGHGLGGYGHGMGLRLYEQVPAGTSVQMLHWGESIQLAK